MTADELKATIAARIDRTYTNANTRKVYRGGLSRIMTRVPMELFGDEAAIRTYRQLLSLANRGIFGGIWRRIHDELTARGLDCVDPERLAYRMRVPSMMAYSAEVLAVSSSYPMVATARWGDVRSVRGEMVMGRAVLDMAGAKELMRLRDYFWGATYPDPEAPVLPWSRACRHRFFPVEMIEDMVKDLHEGETLRKEAKAVYTIYRKLSEGGYTIDYVQARVGEADALVKLGRTQRDHAAGTLDEAIKALTFGRRSEFERLWQLALEGQRGTLIQVPSGKAAFSRATDGGWTVRLHVAETADRG